MHPSWSIALATLLLLTSAAAEPVRVLTDSEGDVDANLPDGSTPPGGTYDPEGADLLWLDVDETTDSFRFDLAVAEVAPSDDGSGYADFFVEFMHADQAYRLVVQRFPNIEGSFSYDAEVQSYDAGRERFVTTYPIDLVVDAGQNVYSMTVPRDALVDGNGTAPTAGREFRLLRVQSVEQVDSAFLYGAIQMRDHMPDDGVSDLPYKVQRGLTQTGHARLESDDPVRASNGEEATFVYYVEAHNLEERDDRFDLAVDGVPDGWDVTLPAATLRVPGNGSVRFPVLVSTQFNHLHGAFESFLLTLTSHRDTGAIGRLEMGIRFLETPQPAGHHDTLWIHTRSAAPSNSFCIGCSLPETAFMNAVQDHDLDEDVPVYSDDSGRLLGGGNGWRWTMYLEPGLQMGLDFDVNSTGTIEATFDAPLSIQDASLGGRLVHYAVVEDGGASYVQRTVLAELVGSTPTDLSGTMALDTVLVPTSASDFIRYNLRAALALELELSGNNFSVYGTEEQTQPALMEGQMSLPLFEYRDPVDHVFSQLAGLDFRHADRAEKYVNPGETVLFNLTLQNDGAIDDVFELRVNGTNQDWVRVLGDRRVFVGTGDHRNVVVAVSPPKDAPDGAVVDLVVTAASVAEPTVQGNIRVAATVDALVDRTDESGLIQDAESRLTDKKSPSVAAPLVLLGIALLALRRHD